MEMEEQIEGTVEEIIYENESTGYRVFTVDCGGTLINAVGTCAVSYTHLLPNQQGQRGVYAALNQIKKPDPGQQVYHRRPRQLIKHRIQQIIEGKHHRHHSRNADQQTRDSPANGFFLPCQQPHREQQRAGGQNMHQPAEPAVCR